MRFKQPLQSQLSDPMMYAASSQSAARFVQEEPISKPKKRKPTGGRGGTSKRRKSQQKAPAASSIVTSSVSWQQLINSDQQQTSRMTSSNATFQTAPNQLGLQVKNSQDIFQPPGGALGSQSGEFLSPMSDLMADDSLASNNILVGFPMRFVDF